MNDNIKNIILDTDAGSDCDDMLALGYLIRKAKLGEIKINAVTYSHVSTHGAAAIRGTFRYFGEDAPPVGVMVNGNPFDDHYVKALDERFATEEDRAKAEPAAVVLRRALTSCEGKAVICAVGPLTNIAALLKSEADDISPLNGVALVAEKCEKMILMAGRFIPEDGVNLHAEWNVKCDIPAARTVADLSPVPLAWLPSETGMDMITGRPMMKRYGEASPISLAFKLFPWAEDGRHSWDPASALYAVEGARELFTEIRGKVTVNEQGVTALEKDPESESCVILVNTENATEQEAKARVADYLDSVVMALHEETEARKN